MLPHTAATITGAAATATAGGMTATTDKQQRPHIGS